MGILHVSIQYYKRVNFLISSKLICKRTAGAIYIILLFENYCICLFKIDLFYLLSGCPNKYLIENSEQIMYKYSYTWEMMPLIYTILNLVHGDVEAAFKRIDEGSFLLF